LNRFLMVLTVVFLVISFLVGDIFYLIALALMVYAYYRMLSRNIYRRAAENRAFMALKARILGVFGKKKREMAQRKDFHIYKCPRCRQKIRVPRGKGRIEISCRKCNNKFIRKS